MDNPTNTFIGYNDFHIVGTLRLLVLDACDLTCAYNAVEVLHEVKVRVRPGDFIGVLGPNGSGKTTLVRALCRTLKPVKGSVKLGGLDIYSLTAKYASRSIAVVPQDIAIPFNFSTLDIVLMGRNPFLSFFDTEGARELFFAEKAMRLANCYDLALRPINQLSSGERRRVLIARALCQEPKILLLDEPTSHLDIYNQIETMSLLRRLAEEKKLGILSVFHDLTLAARYCSSLLMLKDGRMFSSGSIEDVITATNIRAVFRVNVNLRRDETTGALSVEPTSLFTENAPMPEEV